MQKIMQMTDEQQRMRRVLNLLVATRRVGMTDKARAVRQLLYWQPGAREIRAEHKCPACKRGVAVSYRMPDDGMRGDREQCGFYCGVCRWGAGGTREVWVRKGGRG